jgi:glyoxylase-like metal-dependent hydrolase (beta-lactamase superfamily II)
MRIERILAKNPGPYTGAGTNTWLLDDGAGNVAVIDPGPVDPDHADEIVRRIGDRRAVSVIVTHTHSDHAPLANPLARELGVAAFGYDVGPDFVPDLRLSDGDRYQVGDLSVEVLHTPGHSDDHLCFLAGRVMFTGDHVIGGSSVMVEDLGRYLASLRRVQGFDVDRMYPGHGEEIDRPAEVLDWYLAHRLQRHEEVHQAVAGGAETVADVLETVYADVDRSLHPLAARSVTAHLRLLDEEGRITFKEGRAVPMPPS